MKTEICYHFYKTKTVLSKPEYLYFPTVQLQNYSIQDLLPKKTTLISTTLLFTGKLLALIPYLPYLTVLPIPMQS